MSLAGLADDILVLILAYSCASAQLNLLYCCGDVALNTRIRRAVREIDTGKQFHARKLTNFPSFLTAIQGLRNLNLCFASSEEFGFKFVKSLQLLPSSLLELHLSVRKIGSAFAQAVALPSHSTTSSSSHIDANQAQRPILDLKRSFPSLESLILIDFASQSSCISSNLLLALPESLRTLRWTGAYLERKDNLLALPRGLTDLHLEFIASKAIFHTLPPGLLSLFVTSIPTSDPMIWQALPRTITRLDTFRFSAWNPRIAELVPPDLKSMTIHNADEHHKTDWVEALPKSLTLLNTIPPMSYEHLALLPRTVTTLHKLSLMQHTLLRMAQEGHVWPPALTSLELASKSDFLHPNEVLGLPSQLKELTLLYSIRNVNHLLCERLPSTLTKLRVCPEAKGTANFTKLPSSLTELYAGGAIFTAPALAALPPHLQVFETIMAYHANPELVVALPRRLSTLHCKHIAPSSFCDLPPTLTRLTCIVKGLIVQDHIMALPRHLVYLALDHDSDVKVERYNVFRHLPPRLEQLYMSSWKGIDLIPHLPDSITLLSVSFGGVSDPQLASILPGLSDRWMTWIENSSNAYKGYIANWKQTNAHNT